MNAAVLDFVRRSLPPAAVAGKDVIEAGALNVNGTPRTVVAPHGPRRYVGVDIVPGPGVDAVCGAEDIARRYGPAAFDVAIATELLEHAQDWRAVVANLKRVLRPGGTLVLTTRAPGFPHHAYPGDHWRFTAGDLCAAFADMDVAAVEPDWLEPGVFVLARMPAHFMELGLGSIMPVPAPGPAGQQMRRGRFVNVGCGEFPFGAPWENYDITLVPAIPGYTGRVVRPQDALAVDYAGVVAAYAGHFLEHLELDRARAWLRLLHAQAAPGAVLAVTVPDMARAAGMDAGTVHGMRHGGRRWPGDEHRSEWTGDMLHTELGWAGWQWCKEWPACPWIVVNVPWQVCLRAVKVGVACGGR